MSSKKTDRLINIFSKYFLNLYSILFYSQIRQQGNSPLALRPLSRSCQVLLYPINQKWYKTYSRLNTLILIWKWLLSFVIIIAIQNDLYCRSCYIYLKKKVAKKKHDVILQTSNSSFHSIFLLEFCKGIFNQR